MLYKLSLTLFSRYFWSFSMNRSLVFSETSIWIFLSSSVLFWVSFLNSEFLLWNTDLLFEHMDFNFFLVFLLQLVDLLIQLGFSFLNISRTENSLSARLWPLELKWSPLVWLPGLLHSLNVGTICVGPCALTLWYTDIFCMAVKLSPHSMEVIGGYWFNFVPHLHQWTI